MCMYVCIGEQIDMEEELDNMEKLLEKEVYITPSSASVYCLSFYFTHQQPQNEQVGIFLTPHDTSSAITLATKTKSSNMIYTFSVVLNRDFPI